MSWHEVPLHEGYWFQEGPGIRKWQFTTEGIKLLNVGNIEKDGNLNLAKTDRCLSIEEATTKYKHFLVDEGDLVIASSGISIDTDGYLRTRGSFVQLHDLPLCLNTSTIRFKAKEGVSDLNFLRHWLQSREFRKQITKLVTGSAQLNFGPSHLKATKICLPPLTEQRRIAGILDRGEELRAQRRAAIALLDQLPQAIFIEMFGDPVTNHNDWSTSDLGKYVRLLGGYAFKSKDFASEGVPIVRISNLEGLNLNLSKAAKIPETKVGKGGSFQVNRGDILIAMSGATTGKIGVVPQTAPQPLLLNQRVGKFKILDSESVNPLFLLEYIKTPYYQKFLRSLAAGAAQPNVSGKQLESATFIKPDISVQCRFAARVEAIHRAKAAHESALTELDALFASLQSKAFSGELSTSKELSHV